MHYLGRTNRTRYWHWYVTGKYLFGKQNETVKKIDLAKNFVEPGAFFGQAVLQKIKACTFIAYDLEI